MGIARIWTLQLFRSTKIRRQHFSLRHFSFFKTYMTDLNQYVELKAVFQIHSENIRVCRKTNLIAQNDKSLFKSVISVIIVSICSARFLALKRSVFIAQKFGFRPELVLKTSCYWPGVCCTSWFKWEVYIFLEEETFIKFIK